MTDFGGINFKIILDVEYVDCKENFHPDLDEDEPGDPNQSLPMMDRLLFEHLKTVDHSGLPLDQIKTDTEGW